jgi:chromosome segregation ATPase
VCGHTWIWKLDEASEKIRAGRLPLKLAYSIRADAEDASWASRFDQESARHSLNVGNDLVVTPAETANDDLDLFARGSAGTQPIPYDAHLRIKSLEKTVETQRQEIDERCIQIADLWCVQQQQVEALNNACDAIKRLEDSLSSLQEKLAQRDNEVGLAKKTIAALEQDRDASRKILAKARDDNAALLQKALELSDAFNAREAAIAAARNKVHALEAELSAKTLENVSLAAAVETFDSRLRAESELRHSEVAERQAALDRAITSRDKDIQSAKTVMGELMARYTALKNELEAHELEKAQALAKLKSQADMIVFLETVVRAGRQG